MSQQIDHFASHAIALQCLAEDFRPAAAAARSVTAPEFVRLAGGLNQIAASLIVDHRFRAMPSAQSFSLEPS